MSRLSVRALSKEKCCMAKVTQTLSCSRQRSNQDRGDAILSRRVRQALSFCSKAPSLASTSFHPIF